MTAEFQFSNSESLPTQLRELAAPSRVIASETKQSISPRRAVRMAVEMRNEVRKLTAKWRKSGHDLDFGLGIFHGYATMGRIGFEGRFDYSAIGSVVNLAARLCDEAGPDQILIDRRVYADVKPAGELTLKGFHRPVVAYDVQALQC